VKTSGPPLQIAIVTVADLPEGTGRTSRLKTLVGALRLAHHHVTILVEHALSTTPGQQPSGVLAENGAAFEYVLEKTERSFGFALILPSIVPWGRERSRCWKVFGDLDRCRRRHGSSG